MRSARRFAAETHSRTERSLNEEKSFNLQVNDYATIEELRGFSLLLRKKVDVLQDLAMTTGGR